MPQPCKICNHPLRESIEASIRSGKSINSIAKEHGLLQAGLQRHKVNHMDAKDIADAAVLAPRLEQMIPEPEPIRLNAYEDIVMARDRALALLARVENSEDSSVSEMAIALREVRETVRTMAQLYETQRRIEAEYSAQNTMEATFVYRWMKENCPQILLKMLEAARREAGLSTS